MNQILILLLLWPCLLFAKNIDTPVTTTALQINQLFSDSNRLNQAKLTDLIDKENKISICVDEYIKKQSKQYLKIIQNNLYDLIHNFDKMASKISGKKVPPDDVTYEEKLTALAKIQCETYYGIGVLK